MSKIDALDLTKKNAKRHAGTGRRSAYKAAKVSRLNQGWAKGNYSPDAALYPALRRLRSRSRDIATNNDYGKRFLFLTKQNVIGPDGILLQVRTKRGPAGELDRVANDAVEKAWRQWGKLGTCTADGRLSWLDSLRLIAETIPKDGEVLVRLIRPWKRNRFGFAIQVIEADLLDEELNVVLRNGNRIRMGIEQDQWNSPVAYWLLTQHPDDYLFGLASARRKHVRIPATEILHVYIMERPGQSRGVPMMATPGSRLYQLDGYEEAELINSRTAASKMGFFTTPDGDQYTGEEDDDDEAPIMEAEPGTFEELPAGWDFVKWDPDHPSTAFEPFVMANLRGAASGLNVSYVSLANDLRGVSYSSIRQGVIDDRDAWRCLQGFIVEHVCQTVYEAWLSMSIMHDAIVVPGRNPVSMVDFQKFTSSIRWQARGWDWVDPAKEVNAAVIERQHGFNSSQRIMGQRGRDFYDVTDEIKQEDKIIQFPKPGQTELKEKSKDEEQDDQD
jgi:lambda family phage portal protein